MARCHIPLIEPDSRFPASGSRTRLNALLSRATPITDARLRLGEVSAASPTGYRWTTITSSLGSLFRPRSTKVGRTELKRESAELKADDKGEHEELTAIYVDRGLDPSLAKQVAEQLMAHDALGAHARDELGISETLHARPIQAALASASSFAVGAAAPLLVTGIAPTSSLIIVVPGTSLVFLALLGALAAGAGGANVTVGAIRVTFWGALAMGVTAGAGAVFGTIV
jgi:hypothetical protein